MKKALVSLLSVALAFSAVTPIVSAEGQPSSKATIEFNAPTEKVTPIDPGTLKPIEDSEEPEDPNYPEVTGQNGPLSLDFVSNLDFGEQKISNKDEVYQSTTEAPYIQVTDLRGTGAGWNVQAEISPFTDENDIESLQGFSVQLNNGDTATSSKAGSSPEVNEEIKLEVDKPAEVVKANPKENEKSVNTAQGLGTWLTRWLSDNETNEKVTLKVPAGTASTGEHKATITWTLSSDSPDGK